MSDTGQGDTGHHQGDTEAGNAEASAQQQADGAAERTETRRFQQEFRSNVAAILVMGVGAWVMPTLLAGEWAVAHSPDLPTWDPYWRLCRDAAREWLNLHLSGEDATSFVVTDTVIIATLLVAVAASNWRPRDAVRDEVFAEAWTRKVTWVTRTAVAASVTVSLARVCRSRTAGGLLIILTTALVIVVAATWARNRGPGLQRSATFLRKFLKEEQEAYHSFWEGRPADTTKALSRGQAVTSACWIWVFSALAGAVAGIPLVPATAVAVHNEAHARDLALLTIACAALTSALVTTVYYWVVVVVAALLTGPLVHARRIVWGFLIGTTVALLVVPVWAELSAAAWCLAAASAVSTLGPALLLWRGWRGHGPGTGPWRHRRQRDDAVIAATQDRLHAAKSELAERAALTERAEQDRAEWMELAQLLRAAGTFVPIGLPTSAGSASSRECETAGLPDQHPRSSRYARGDCGQGRLRLAADGVSSGAAGCWPEMPSSAEHSPCSRALRPDGSSGRLFARVRALGEALVVGGSRALATAGRIGRGF